MPTTPSVLITGASSGIGATYADRFARRGHDLVLVARNQDRMEALATKLRQETGVTIDIIRSDLTQPSDLAEVEARLKDDARIGILVNNAGTAIGGTLAQQKSEDITALVALNATAVLRLAHAVTPRFVERGEGAIINIASVVGLVPEFGQTVYGATKAFVLYLSQGMSHEMSSKGIYVQAVLPAATRTEIWANAGADINSIPGLMDVGEMVDAALVGFDRREPVTIPPLPDAGLWDACQAARQAMIPGFGESRAAARYQTKR